MKTLLAVLAVALVFGAPAVSMVEACGGMTTISPPPFPPPHEEPPVLPIDDGDFAEDEVIL